MGLQDAEKEAQTANGLVSFFYWHSITDWTTSRNKREQIDDKIWTCVTKAIEGQETGPRHWYHYVGHRITWPQYTKMIIAQSNPSQPP